jgi:hypothetical protein
MNHTDLGICYQVRYQIPYNNCAWRTQSFPTLDEAERMCAFYISCGSPAHVLPNPVCTI